MSTKPGNDAAGIAYRIWEGCYFDSQGSCLTSKEACTGCIEHHLEKAIAAARADGYQAGITDASKVAHRIAYEYQRHGDDELARVAAQLRDAILTPVKP